MNVFLDLKTHFYVKSIPGPKKKLEILKNKLNQKHSISGLRKKFIAINAYYKK